MSTPTENLPLFDVPNFVEDERARTRYATMLERRRQEFAREHRASLQRHAAAKREELREQLAHAHADWSERSEGATAALAAYRDVCPHRAKRLHLTAPSLLENLKSGRTAAKLYEAARAARDALAETESAIRKLEHNEGQLEIELQKALERAPSLCAEIVASQKWLDEIHAEEELGEAKARVDAIDDERGRFAQRLADGAVSDDERRLRAFAERGLRHIETGLDGVIFESVEAFGPRAWFVLRDLRGRGYTLPYDARLEPLLGGVYDVVRDGARATVRRHARPGGGAFGIADFVRATTSGDEAAAVEAFERHRAFEAEARAHETPPADELESVILDAFAALTAPKAA